LLACGDRSATFYVPVYRFFALASAKNDTQKKKSTALAKAEMSTAL
jgi:hypothetical protein